MHRRRRSPTQALVGLAAAALLSGACKKPAGSHQPELPASITNNQEQGVDEGGIVKVHGDHLVVLRRGRLFTVRVGGDRLDPIAVLDVPRTTRRRDHAWYDEMLIHDGTIVVIGYSYKLRATELALFRIDPQGGLSRAGSFFLSSSDYFSSRNYASRLIGDKLVFYVPQWQPPGAPSRPPSIWRPDDERPRRGAWAPLLDDSEIVPGLGGDVIHAVVTCDLSPTRLGCEARGIRGGSARSFYVSPSAVYVWAEGPDYIWESSRANEGALFRLPLDGGPMTGIRAQGMPVDQFSFREADGQLRVVVRDAGYGDGMWRGEWAGGPLRLLHLPLAALDGRMVAAPSGLYRELPAPADASGSLHNRFVGEYLLYGTGRTWGWNGDPSAGEVLVVAADQADAAVERVPLDHPVDRIEALGDAALVVGGDRQALRLTSLALGPHTEAVGHFTLLGVDQGELRSHGFFFRPSEPGEGILGLPVRAAWEPGAAHLWKPSLGLLFLRVDDLALTRMGLLPADLQAGRGERCVSSCVDWYGNSRPIFLGERIFALLGYEVVEGEIVGRAIRERRRIDMSTLLQP